MQYLQNIFNKKKKKNIDRIRLIQFPFLYIVKKTSAFQSILTSLFREGGNTFWRLVRNIQLQIKNKLLCRNLHFKTSPWKKKEGGVGGVSWYSTLDFSLPFKHGAW